MRRIFLILLFILPLYLVFILYSLDKVYFLCPIEYKGDKLIRCDSRGNGFFGAGRSGRRVHEGIDLLADVGTPVVAGRWGLVISAKQNRGMGKYVIIRHPDNLTTVYGHLSEIFVRKNEFVRQGQVIGAVGKTGNANSAGIQPHLHLEVKKNGMPEDPLEYLE